MLCMFMNIITGRGIIHNMFVNFQMYYKKQVFIYKYFKVNFSLILF